MDATGRSPFDDASGRQLIEFLKDHHFDIEEPEAKYLIAFGGGLNNPAYVRANIATIEASGAFDGMVIEPSIVDPSLGIISAVNSVARTYRLPWELFATTTLARQPLVDIRATDFVRFKKNFIRANIGSRQSVGSVIVNPFVQAEFDTYVNNIGMFGRLAEESGEHAVLFDTERYNSSPFWGTYALRDPGSAHTHAEWKAKMQELGEASMNELDSTFPDGIITIAVSYEQTKQNPTTPPENNNYWLQPSFLDGMHNAAKSSRRIVNMMEDGYSNQTPADFVYDVLYQTRGGLGSTLGSPNYENVHEHGMSTWIDYPGTGFDFVDPSTNYNTPAIFKNNILLAAGSISPAGRYVFLYAQQGKWWGGTAGVDAYQAAYVTALAEARAALP